MWVGVRRTLINFARRRVRSLARHDFSAFSNKSRDGKSKERDPTRSIYRFDVVEQEDGLLRLEVEGNGFLYRMVRNMVGAALLEATKKGEGGEVARLRGGGIVAPRRWEHRRTDCFCTRWCIQRHSGRRGNRRRGEMRGRGTLNRDATLWNHRRVLQAANELSHLEIKRATRRRVFTAFPRSAYCTDPGARPRSSRPQRETTPS